MKTKPRVSQVVADNPITAYSCALPLPLQAICDAQRELIDTALPQATNKIWHGIPVWFINDNPVVGYKATTRSVNLMFWNGQAFEESELQPIGKFKAAQVVFADVAEIDPKAIRRWLKKAKTNVLDSKTHFKKVRETKPTSKLQDGATCKVIGGVHAGKSGTVRDINISKTGHVTITVVQANGERFKTLAKNVEV